MTIHIVYRHTDNLAACGVGKNRPSWFSFDGCLNNILSTIEGIDFVKFHLIYDGVYKGNDSRIHHVEEINEHSGMGAWLKAWKYAQSLELADNDLIYHLENDYMHVPGWPYKVKELYETFDELSYITLYDHPHFYNQRDYPGLQTYLFTTKTHHWNTRPSTTGAFIINKSILFEDYELWVSSPGDHYKFLWLGQNRQRTVLAPIPTLSTHCEVEWLATNIEWEKIK